VNFGNWKKLGLRDKLKRSNIKFGISGKKKYNQNPCTSVREKKRRLENPTKKVVEQYPISFSFVSGAVPFNLVEQYVHEV
jgi:hypothetical protein